VFPQRSLFSTSFSIPPAPSFLQRPALKPLILSGDPPPDNLLHGGNGDLLLVSHCRFGSAVARVPLPVLRTTPPFPWRPPPSFDCVVNISPWDLTFEVILRAWQIGSSPYSWRFFRWVFPGDQEGCGNRPHFPHAFFPPQLFATFFGKS